jgi:hypothetical protein
VTQKPSASTDRENQILRADTEKQIQRERGKTPAQKSVGEKVWSARVRKIPCSTPAERARLARGDEN